MYCQSPLKHFLRMENFLASQLLERLISSFILLSKQQQSNVALSLLSPHLKEMAIVYQQLASTFLMKTPGFFQEFEQKEIHPLSFLSFMNQWNDFFIHYLAIMMISSKDIDCAIDFFNDLYEKCFSCHLTLFNLDTTIVIDPPRFYKATFCYPSSLPIAKFFFIKEKILEEFILCNETDAEVLLLEKEKHSIYEKNIDQAKCFLTKGELENSKERLLRAKKIKASAEVFTLLGHIFHLQGQLKTAKEMCLKALQIDPLYGPALNDLGSFELIDGYLEKAKYWFSKAKEGHGLSFQEYPYLNLARIYLLEQETFLALQEFERAKKIAPLNTSLNDLIAQVKRSVLFTTTTQSSPEF